MENYVRIDHEHRRVAIRAQGQWTLDLADQWYDDMVRVRDWSQATGEPITILADLDGLILHTQEVSRRIEESVVIMRQFPIDRYILVVPSFLMRMQCRRLLDGIAHSFSDSVDEAKSLLGWTVEGGVAA